MKKWGFEGFTNTLCESLKKMKNYVLVDSSIQNFESYQLDQQLLKYRCKKTACFGQYGRILCI